MSLIAPTPGEILDRLSILALKIPVFQEKEIFAAHLEAEKSGLEEKMFDWDNILRAQMADQITWDMLAEQRNTLAAVNAILWQAEDDVRSTSQNDSFKLASLCLRIAKMNDARSRAIRRMNELYGADAGQEKIYERQVFVSDESLGVE